MAASANPLHPKKAPIRAKGEERDLPVSWQVRPVHWNCSIISRSLPSSTAPASGRTVEGLSRGRLSIPIPRCWAEVQVRKYGQSGARFRNWLPASD